MMTRLAIVAGIVLAGCGAQTGGGPSAPPTSGADTCNAAAYMGLIGQDSVVTLSVPEPKRSYRPDEVVTQDFNPARVNFRLDETDVIIGVECG